MQTHPLLYRGYEVTEDAAGNWSWTDERGVLHDGEPGAKYRSDEEALNSIDAYKRNVAKGG